MSRYATCTHTWPIHGDMLTRLFGPLSKLQDSPCVVPRVSPQAHFVMPSSCPPLSAQGTHYWYGTAGPCVAEFVLVTASAADASSFEALGGLIETTSATGQMPRLVAVLSGEPAAGISSLMPICTSLGVRRLIVRTEHDPDVAALKQEHQVLIDSAPSFHP